MAVLSKGIYQRPVEACIREISTNAFDSHVEAGFKNKPFEVRLPTYENQTFVVRDYGNGISPERIRPVFSTYFASSKSESNEYVGCLGIGALSPFAIASQFTVESWFEGFYYLWQIFKDESGIPSMHDEPLVKEPTTEPTGVRITVPVSNLNGFESTAKKVYQSFDVTPIIWKGSQRVTIEKERVQKEYKNFYIEDVYENTVYALMGNVRYPIDTSIPGLEGYRELGNNYRVIIPCEIGGLDFAASREGLEYNSGVVSTLILRYNAIVAELQVSVQAAVDAAPNAFQAVAAFIKMKLPSKMNEKMYSSVLYKGKTLSSYFPNRNTNIPLLTDPVSKVQTVLLSISRIGSFGKKHYQTVNDIPISSTVKIYYNDEKNSKGHINRIYQHSNRDYYISDTTNLTEWLKQNYLTLSDLIPISSLPKVSGYYSYEGRTKSGLSKVVGGDVKKRFWSKEIKEAPETGYYLERCEDDFIKDGKKYFTHCWDEFEQLGVLPQNVYGISKSHLKKYTHWVKLDDYMIPILQKIRADVEFAYLNTHLSELHNYWPDGDFKDKLSIIEKYDAKLSYWTYLYSFFEIPLTLDKTKKIDEKEIYKKYPLLPHIDNRHNSNSHLIKEYIKMVDNGKMGN